MLKIDIKYPSGLLSGGIFFSKETSDRREEERLWDAGRRIKDAGRNYRMGKKVIVQPTETTQAMMMNSQDCLIREVWL